MIDIVNQGIPQVSQGSGQQVSGRDGQFNSLLGNQDSLGSNIPQQHTQQAPGRDGQFNSLLGNQDSLGSNIPQQHTQQLLGDAMVMQLLQPTAKISALLATPHLVVENPGLELPGKVTLIPLQQVLPNLDNSLVPGIGSRGNDAMALLLATSNEGASDSIDQLFDNLDTLAAETHSLMPLPELLAQDGMGSVVSVQVVDGTVLDGNTGKPGSILPIYHTLPVDGVFSSAASGQAPLDFGDSIQIAQAPARLYPFSSNPNPFMSNAPQVSITMGSAASISIENTAPAPLVMRNVQVGQAPQQADSVRPSVATNNKVQAVANFQGATKVPIKGNVADLFSSPAQASNTMGVEIPKWYFILTPSSTAQTLWYRNYRMDEKSIERLVERLSNSDFTSNQNINRIIINGVQAWSSEAQRSDT